MATTIEYALLAGASYYDTRTEFNRIPLPPNWSVYSRIPQDTSTGFEATTFTNGTAIVVSFAGTYDKDITGDIAADIGLATGIGSAQLLQAAQYYLTVKRLNPSANITLTGHSLGGGLAALVGVFFGVSATTFDQAPFANTAERNLLTADEAALLKADLLASGYTTTELSGLTNFLSLRQANGGIPNSSLINTIRVDGEFLSVFPLNLYDPIGNPATLIQHGPTSIAGTELHAQSLLTAFLQSQQTSVVGNRLNDVTYKLTNLLAMLFDKNLFAHPTDDPDNRNLLDHLVRHEAGVQGSITADAMVTRFTSDMWKIAQDGGLTLTNQDITNTLVAFAMQMYYENPQAAVVGKTLFTSVSVTGGIRFDRTDVSATLSGAKGWQLYFQNYLNTLTLEEHRIVEQLLPAATDWFIQAGSVGMNATADIKKAFMVGGIGNDWMVGGSQADLLIGNAGDDTLKGGANNDTLIGGAGFDTYVVNAGDGYDTVLDSDGQGKLMIGSLTLSGGALVSGATNIWKNAAQGITYTLKGSGSSQVLLIGKDGSSDGIRVQGWQLGQLSLTMAGSVAPPATTTLTGADGYSDALTGGGGADRILGLSGNDALDGSAGADIIEGGVGDDLIGGNSGSDLIYGGSGKDMILSATGLTLPGHLGQNGEWTPPTGAGPVWTQGRVWGVYASTDANGPVYIIDGGGPNAPDSAGDIVFAGDDDDRVIGGLGDDYIDGGLANDNLTGHGGNDVIDGGEGNDVIEGDGIILPGYYSSVAEALHGNDVLDGGAGNDTLIGGGRDDGLFGGSGKDTLYGDDATEADLGGQYHGSDYLDGGDNDDDLLGGGKDDFLFGRDGADKLWGDVDDEADLAGQYHGNDYLDGGDGDDQLVGGGGNDILVGGIGVDVMYGDARPGTALAAQYQGDDILYGDAGDDQLVGGGGNDDLYGGDDLDTLLGESGIDLLDGGAGNDNLDGGTGADIMAGGAGDDTYIVDDAGDVVIEAANEGTDTINSSVSIVLPGNVEWLKLTGAGNVDATGNDDANNITGNAGANRLTGGAGNDQLIGGAGADTLIGGTGDDYYEIDNASDTITEALGEGDDFVRSTVSYALAANLERLAFDGAGNLAGTGNALNNSLFGNLGNNTLAGGVGNDYLVGGAGNDVYVFNRGDGQDSIDNTDLLSATDTLRFGAGIAESDVLGFQVGMDMVLKLRGTGGQVAFGNYYGANTVNGGVVSDHKIDRVEFANGVVWDQAMIQTMVDRATNNRAPTNSSFLPALQTTVGNVFTYVVPAGTITDPDAGDTVTYSVKMPDGSLVPSWLTFDAATRTLSGMPGSANVGSLQFMLWGTDNYGYAVGQMVNLNVGVLNRAPVLATALPDQAAVQGNAFIYTVASTAFTDPDAGDTLTYNAALADGSALPSWLSFNAVTRTLSGTPSSLGTTSVRVTANDAGNLSASDVFDVVVSAPNLVLNGTAGADYYLVGGAGNDTFDGGLGNDTLQGLTGNDTYLFGVGDGQDTIIDTGGNADVLRFKAGITPQQIGIVRNDWLVSGEDSLVLQLLDANGATTLDYVYIRAYFNDDNDTRRVDRIEFANGTAWTYADIQARLPVATENSDFDLKGYAGADVIDGLGGNDIIYGRAGDDTLRGGNGNDTLYGEAGNDSLDGGIGDDDVQGGLGNDILLGGAGNDRLLGYQAFSADDAGNDVLYGGTGNDRMFGGQGNDTYLFGRGDGYDSVGDTPNADGSSSTDVLRLAAGVLPQHVTLYRFNANDGGGEDLMVVLDGSNQQISLSNYYFVYPNGVTDLPIERIEFDGGAGAVWTAADIASRVQAGVQNSMTGTASDDTFVVDHELDAITEAANSGVDKVLASRTYTLPDNVENLTLTGVLNINGTGNALDNILRGNSGDNVLTGNGGNDVAYGGQGNDTYKGVAPIELADEGIDTYLGGGNWSWVLPDNVENWNLNDDSGYRSNYNYSAMGNALDNILTSDGFGVRGDILDGGAGADTVIIRGSDKPIVYIDNPGDRVVGGAYEIRSSIDYVLSRPLNYSQSNTPIPGSVTDRLVLIGSNPISGTGNAVANVLTGNGAANVLDGDLGADTLVGGLGNDTYVVDNLGDVVTETSTLATEIDSVQSSIAYTLGANVENLTLTGSAVIDGTGNELANTLTGNSANNVLTGGAGNDTLLGGTGNDRLDGGLDADTMTGGLGDDTYVVDNAGDIVTENRNEGYWDTVESSISYILGANVESLTLTGTAVINGTGNAMDNTLTGNGANNVLTGGAGYDTLDGGVGADTMVGGTEDDYYYVDNVGDIVTENANEGDDSVELHLAADYTLSANVEGVYRYGTGSWKTTGNASDNYLYGNNGSDTLIGLGGNDVLYGDAGADTLIGGVGDDRYYVDNAGDIVTEKANEGVDTVYVFGSDSLTYTLAANVENGYSPFWAGNLTGNALNNTLSGSYGSDTLDGSLGADTLNGWGGNDTYIVDNVGDVVSETSTLATEIDTVQSSVTYTLGANVENLTLTGTAAINGTGNAQANALSGNNAANILDGGLGTDTLVGGAGDDTYVVDNAGDVVTENLNEGYWDTVESSISYSLGANVEGLTLTGTAVINGTGNALDNTLTGNSAGNVLTGGVGNDTLDGGAGSDTLVGGLGDDYYVVDNAGDIVTENAGEGDDSIELYLTADYTLSANVEGVYRYGAGSWKTTGNALNNYLYGNGGKDILLGLGGNDTLWGGSGADTMQGGTGDDLYYVDNVGDIVTENANEGTDTVYVWSTVAHTLAANVENGVRMFNAGSLIGNALNNTLTGAYGVDMLDGGAGADTLNGGYGNDTLIGGGGFDRLDGGVDADTMTGGLGDDTYVVDNAGDVVTENLNEGYWDTVESSISYSLGANVESLTLTGTAAINGTGNALDNTLTGNGANNVLTGGAGYDTLDGGVGADTMVGGTEDDYYYVDNAGDIVTESATEGDDSVELHLAADYTLSVNVEGVYRYGTGSWKTTGNASDNYLYGNNGSDTLIGLGGNDTLWGGSGADTMLGGVGDDIYYVDNAGDVVTEAANEGMDMVYVWGTTAYTLAANVENGVRMYVAGGLTGNALDNTLTGAYGVDTLDGGAGNDALIGGAGNDTLLGGTGNDRLDGGLDVDSMSGGGGDDTYVVDNAGDVVTENLNEGYWDTVESSISYTLGANVESLTLTGTAAINGTGNALDNSLIGNNASNVLTGGAGNDTLDGGAGSDTMVGGLGDDYYVVDNTGDVVTENAGEGADGVDLYQTSDYTLGANVENATRYSTGSWKTTGNELNNYLYGNEGNDTLIGLGGNDFLFGDAGTDTMQGGTGNDTYYVDNAGDVVTENASEGTDTVYIWSSMAHTLAANVENGSRTFYAGSLTGNSLNNILTGSYGNDTLIGDAGDDRLTGLGGADTLTGGTGNDTYTLGRGYAADTVVENDTTAGNTDIAQFLTGVIADQIWFQHVGNNLEASIIGTSDKLVVKDWYLASANHVEQFKTTDGGKTLLDSNVQNLVNAMAMFAPPAAGQTTLPTTYQASLAPVIAANWQ